MLLGQYETYSRRRNLSPSLTRSLPLVSPFQGCPLNPDISYSIVMRRRAKLISTRRAKDWDAGLYVSYCPNHNSRPTQ
ncbi:MAG: hypothetical protein DVB29_07690 [Verrucomicrobia bacterium]|nr:MAG: hypothetical protein DVB29_07690 [Verrucomicrobiota bacterium]